jgi:GntR family transcriptional regulator of vanillate catabolism
MGGHVADPEVPKEDVSQLGKTLLLLREMLLRGEFQPGERLSELPLVARLSVSRTPIRLALERLAHEGLLEPSASGGFMAREFTPEDVWDAIEIRGVLEGTAARLAAERLVDVSELENLKRYHNEIGAIEHWTMASFSRFLELNAAFHTEVVRLSKCPMLRWTLDRVISLPFGSPGAMIPLRSTLPGTAGRVAISLEQHRAIIEAIERREGARAEGIAREHARMARRTLEIALADKEMRPHVPGGALIKK